MNALYLTALALLGLAFGSFANVVIYRFPRGESLSAPPSHCPSCDEQIRWYDNIPLVSWLLLKGRCRDCRAEISIRYPVVEALSMLLWLLAGYLFGMSPKAGVAVAFFYALLILAFIDLDTGRLPNPIVLALALVGVASIGLSYVVGYPLAPLTAPSAASATSAVVLGGLGIGLGGGVSIALALGYELLRKRQGLGMGDIKLLAALGPFLGPYVLLSLFFGSVLHLIGVVVSLIVRRPLPAKAPFGPALALGAILTVAVGVPLWSWYLRALI